MEPKKPSAQTSREFESTRWSLILTASQGAESHRRRALSELCEVYWPPVYAYARRRGKSTHDAQDLTQAFFARLLENNAIAAANPERGRFRAFLLSSFRNFMTNEWNKTFSLKRGGGQKSLRLDFVQGEKIYTRTQANLPPERLFERQWATALLDRVMRQLRDEQSQSGKGPQFELLKFFLAGKSRDRNYRDVAKELKMTESAAMSAASRLRRRYRELLTAEILHTLADPSDVDDEIRALFQSLGG